MKSVLIALVMFAALSGPAIAQVATQPTADSMTAGTLYNGCLASDAAGSDDGLCTAYFRGLTDGLWIMELRHLNHNPTCMPADTPVSVADARRMFNRWMSAHPETAGNSAGLVATMAVINSFSCSKSN